MGIKFLNSYLQKQCSTRSIRSVPLSYFRGKSLVIDTFIYLYKYIGEERLEERFHQLIRTLQSHEIRPVFVIDGKPPEEKRALLAQRRAKKAVAEQAYQLEMAKTVDSNPHTLKELKKQFIHVRFQDVQTVKDIMKQYEVEYIEASAEADNTCVDYVKKNKAWACVSDDMDMLVYGCERVVRNVCLDHGTVELYTLSSILYELKMSMNQFREVMVLSGTDYNTDHQTTLFHTVRLFREYKKSTYVGNRATTEWFRTHNYEVMKRNRGELPISFYEWLRRYTGYIKDYDKLLQVNALFR